MKDTKNNSTANATTRRHLLLALAAAGGWPSLAWSAAELSAPEIMKRNFHASKVQSLETETTMVLTTEGGQRRERRMKTLQRLKPNGIDSKLVMRFEAPADIRGVGYLQIENNEAEDDQWIYLPALKKSRRLVANNKKDSFMGSDFSYGDFSRPKVETHQHALLRSEASDGHDCFVIESVPRDPGVRDERGYSRKVTWVRKDSFLEARIDYHDLRGELLKTQTATDHQIVEPETGRWFVMHREIVNHQTKHKTTLHVERARAGVAAPDDAFTSQTIERG
jgi:uncharacterized protein